LAIEALNIEDMGSLRIGAQALRSKLGISSGPVDFCVLVWDSSNWTCWDVMVNSSGTERIGNLAKMSGGISFEILQKDSAIVSANSAPRLKTPLWKGLDAPGDLEKPARCLTFFQNSIFQFFQMTS
jgi:hypothetical protein